MKKIILLLTLTILTGTAFVKAQQAQTTDPKVATIKIKTSAECDMCKERIEKEINLMKGVKSAVLDLSTKELTVVYNPQKVTPDKIRTAISNIGYDADDVKANNRARKELPTCCQPKADSTPH